MTKFLLLLTALGFVSLTARGQIIYEQTFENGLEDMTIVDNDGKTPAGNVSTYTDAWNIRIGHDGNAAVSNSWYAPAAVADDWLITPALEIVGSENLFYWEARAVDPNFADGYQVLLSTTDNNIESFTTVLYETSAESTTVSYRSVSLADYDGQTVYVAIRNNSNDKFLLIVDNIVVGQLKDADVAVRDITGRRWCAVGEDKEVTFNVKNYGLETITSMEVTFDLNGAAVTETVTGLNIQTLHRALVTLDNTASIAAENQYDLVISVEKVNESESTEWYDGTQSYIFNGIATEVDRIVVAEEGTGTWCPWCPRGEVFMAFMYENYPDDFIGIAAHNNDPMDIGHDDYLTFAGYPSAHTNRVVRDIDPSDFEVNYLSEKAVVTPLSASMDLEYNEATREVTMNVTTAPVIDATGTDLRYSIIVMEDGLTGTTAAWAQANNYANNAFGPMGGYENLPNPVPASQMVYNHVSRDVIGGFGGEVGSIGDLVKSSDQSATYTYTLPAENDPMRTSMVLLILDGTTGEILNATKEEVQMFVNTNETLTQIASSIYPNPASDVAQVELNLEVASEVNITIMDVTGKIVASRDYGTVQGNQIFPIQVANFTNGMYMVHIATDSGVSTKRLMVTK